MSTPLQFPEEYVDEFYRRDPDLAGMSPEQRRDHYLRHGRQEGRCASPGATRQGLASLIGNARALEIGPFARPFLKGKNVRYFDVLDTDGLRRRAIKVGEDPKGCPDPVHYVDPHGNLDLIDEHFEIVLSSHAIEHQPDLVHHLRQVAKKLEAGGRYLLIVPDKRFCFDHFLAESTVADVIDACVRNPHMHSVKSVIEHRCLTTHNDAIRHWKGDSGPRPVGDAGAINSAVAEAIEAHRAGTYLDVHAWYFTPQSFRSVFTSLLDAGYSPFEVERVYDTPHQQLEFVASLRLPT
ncbi:MAG: hypothetical protein ABL953_04965 [Ilumatobacteraceae bacterium]